MGPHVSPAPGEAAEKGTAIHAFLEAILDGVDPDEALPEDAQARAVCEKIDAREVHEVAGPDPSTETPFGWDPATGDVREAPRATTERRDYSALPEGWVAGTADAVSEEGAAVRVTDWKTGSYEVPDPGENPQLLFLGLAAARARGKDRAILQVVRVNDEGTLRARAAELGPDDLALAEAALVAVLEGVNDSRRRVPKLRPGRHCRFCPALHRCPAIAGEAQALLKAPFEELDPASAAEAWERLAALEAALKRAREALSLYVARRGGAAPPKRGTRPSHRRRTSPEPRPGNRPGDREGPLRRGGRKQGRQRLPHLPQEGPPVRRREGGPRRGREARRADDHDVRVAARSRDQVASATEPITAARVGGPGPSSASA